MNLKRTRQFAFYCVLWLTAAGSAFVCKHSLAQDAPTNQVVFFSIPVDVDAAPIYASPSRSSYQTGAVLKDRYVEVYFHNRHGFCAIRPPHGSFSWINGKFVELSGNSSGLIVSPNGKAIPSRVGGDSPSTSSVVQVGLQHGQKVTILGKVGLSDGSTWYKIAPPPGEFRWIESKSLVQDAALEHLPPKLMFQSEYIGQFTKGEDAANDGAPVLPNDADDNLELTLPDFDDFDQESQEQSNVNTYDEKVAELNNADVDIDVSAFKLETSRLNADVFQTLQKKPVSKEDLQILELRTEALFDAAPSDDERFGLQAIYDLLKKTEKGVAQGVQAYQPDGQNAAFDVSAPYQGQGATFGSPTLNGTFPQNGSTLPSTGFSNIQPNFKGSNVRWVQAFDENGNAQMLPVDQNGVVLLQDQILGNPTPNSLGANGLNNGNGIGSLPPSYVSSNRLGSTNKGKTKKTSFAFSSENSPFSPKSKSPRIVVDDVSEHANSNLSRLPSLFPTPQTIVPPQDYNVGVPLSQTRQNSRLVAQAQRKASQNGLNDNAANKTETQLASSEASRARKPQGTLVFQAPQLTDSSSKDPQAKDSTVTPASSETKKANNVEKTNKIRQTGSFTPITVRSADGFEAKGTLIAVSSPGDGAPRYALIDAAGNNLSINAYLESSKGVILESFVGKKVGVKGNVGSVAVDGQTYKLIIVSSVFPL